LDDIEAHPNWDYSPYSQFLEDLFKTATIMDGVPFASGRPKDLPDLH
jgi:hypothetical protein